MANPIYEGSSQETSDSEESSVPVLTQKKPAIHCLKHLKKASAIESDSAESQVTSQSDETSETKRIKVSKQAWRSRPKAKSKSKPSAPKEDESSTQETSDCSNTMADQQTEIPKPASSGMLDYCSWMVDQLSPEERESAATNWWQTFAEFCGGMGTGIMCFEGLRRALAAHHLTVHAACACVTEPVKWKSKALKELLECLEEQTHPCPIFSRTGDLNNLVLTDFEEEVVLEKPTFHLLLQGIVCIDISSLTTTPKSVMDIEGQSGQSCRELISYLDELRFEDRPGGIILECVLRLSQKRKKGLLKPEVGTELVSAGLRTLGYVGAWEQEDALKAYLPQSRKRTWGLFLKVTASGPNPLEAERKRRDDVSAAFSIMKRLRVRRNEPLEVVVGRLGIAPGLAAESEVTTQKHLHVNMDWATRGAPQNSMKKLGLAPKDLLASEDLKAFWTAAGSLMNQSCRRHTLMRLCSLRKKGTLPDWRESVLAFNADESAYRLGVGITHFPCVQPQRLHIMALTGKMVKADGKVCLAMQGIQSKELNAFPSLSKLTSRRQQDLAGNAFTANVCAAYILALAVVR